MNYILDFLNNTFKLFGAATILMFIWRKIIYKDSRVLVMIEQHKTGIHINFKNLYDKPIYISKINIISDKVLYSRTGYGFQMLGDHNFEVDKPYYKNIEQILNTEKKAFLNPNEEMDFIFDEMIVVNNESDFKNTTLKELIARTIINKEIISIKIIIKSNDPQMRQYINKIPFVNIFTYNFDIDLKNITSTFEDIIKLNK